MMVTHAYMGPVPAFFFAAGQLMDYGVHTWDLREGRGMVHALNGDVADLLVPFMFALWQGTCRADTVTEPFDDRHPCRWAQRGRLQGLGQRPGHGLRAR